MGFTFGEVVRARVMPRVTLAPCEIRDQQGRVQNETDGGFETLSPGEGVVTALVCQNPEPVCNSSVDGRVRDPKRRKSPLLGHREVRATPKPSVKSSKQPSRVNATRSLISKQ